MRPLSRFIVPIIGAALVAAPAAAQQVGTATAVNPTSESTPPGGTTGPLVVGARIVHKERIHTTPQGTAQLLFTDAPREQDAAADLRSGGRNLPVGRQKSLALADDHEVVRDVVQEKPERQNQTGEILVRLQVTDEDDVRGYSVLDTWRNGVEPRLVDTEMNNGAAGWAGAREPHQLALREGAGAENVTCAMTHDRKHGLRVKPAEPLVLFAQGKVRHVVHCHDQLAEIADRNVEMRHPQ